MAEETPVTSPEEKKPKRKSSFEAFRSPRVIPPLEPQLETPKADSPVESQESLVESRQEILPVEIPAQKILEPTITVPSRVEPTMPVRAPTPQLRHHEEEPVDSSISPIKIQDPRPPPGAAFRPLSSKGIRSMAVASDDLPPAARHRPAPYEPPPTPSVGAMDAETLPHITSRVPLPRTEYSGGKAVRRSGDPIIQAMDEAFAAFGPEEHVVDIRVEVFDEATRQYWEIGTAIAQPMSVAKIPASYLKFAGLYRVTVGPSGEGFPPRRSRPFTVRILGPQRPVNWFFDESDIGGTVYGERGGNFMGYAGQPIVPPQGVVQNPVGAAVQSVRELKDLKKLLSDDDDDNGGGGSRRLVELEQELRMARMQGGMGGGWGGGPPQYLRQKEEEERRRRDEEDRRRAEEERRRVEEIERKRLVDEERRRSDDEKRRGEEERRRIEDERRHTEAEARRREMQDLQAKFDLQMTEVQRQAEETRRRADDAERKASERERDLVTQKEREDERRRYEESRRLEEDRRREEKDRWEVQQRTDKERFEEQRREDRQRTEVQLAEIRKQNDVLAAKLAEAPKETPLDKLLSNLPATLIQAKDLFAGNRTEALAAQQQAREDSRLERERIRDDANRQMTMWQSMSTMNVESVKSQAAQSQEHMRQMMDFMAKGNNNNAIFDSVAGLMKTQTEVFSSVARMNLSGGNSGPSPWVDVAAGAIEAAGNLATSVIAAKLGASPEMMKQMLGLSGAPEEQVGPAVRRPPVLTGPPRVPQVRPPAPVQQKPVVIPRAPAPARTPAAQPAVRKPTASVQPAQGPQVEVPGIPKKIMNRVLLAAQSGEPPQVVARKLFNLVDLCDAHELHKGNADAEKIMKGLTVEILIPNEIKRFFGMAGVTDEEYLAAITFVYLKLIYANVETLRKVEQGEPETEVEQAAEPEAEQAAEPEVEPAPEQEATEPESAEQPQDEPVVEPAQESEVEQAGPEEPVAEVAPEAEAASEPEAPPEPPKPKVRLVSRRIVKPSEVKE